MEKEAVVRCAVAVRLGWGSHSAEHQPARRLGAGGPGLAVRYFPLHAGTHSKCGQAGR